MKVRDAYMYERVEGRGEKDYEKELILLLVVSAHVASLFTIIRSDGDVITIIMALME